MSTIKQADLEPVSGFSFFVLFFLGSYTQAHLPVPRPLLPIVSALMAALARSFRWLGIRNFGGDVALF